MEKQISITKIKIRHSQILLFLNCPKKPETLQGELRFQNAWLNFCHPVAFYPVGKSLVCPINTDKLENYDGDWKLTIQDSNDTYTPVFTSRVRLSLLLGRHFVRNEETLFFPMGGASHSFLLRCRRWQKQDHLTFRIKELTAFGIAKLFGRSLKEKHMWLVYEKFCITAQENGFYFFVIAFSNEKKFFQQAAARKSFRPIENTFQNCLACVSVLKSFFYARAASSTFTSSESLPVIKSPSGGGTSPLPPPAPCGRSLKDAAYCAPSETQFPVSENV